MIARTDRFRRVVDLVVGGAALILVSPVLALLALVVRLTSKGPALFRQERVGRDRVSFTCLKLRTMYADADDGVHREYVHRLLTEERPPDGGAEGVFKLANDPRVTPVGRWLRRTSLDELPQLVNVVRGEMSLVGPRPSLPWEVELFEPRHLKRFEVKPGITGLWQVSGRSRVSVRSALDLDVEYVERRTVGGDLAILARTFGAVVRGGEAA
jgi:lipopolysaccharide/colanic/teichoic acid biosynthesis glycosyltransferase